MIVSVTQDNLKDAAFVHAASWRESHGFCTPEFIALHTTQRQAEYLGEEIALGKDLFMLVESVPVGVVSVKDDLIENLYILPGYQRRGFGTRLLAFAERQCHGRPVLWILSNNDRGRNFYLKNGYSFTGRRKKLSDELSELEMRKK